MRIPFLLRVGAVLCIVGLAACGSAPDLADCGRYYNHLIRLQEAGHRAVMASMLTPAGKDAVIEYCMDLRKSQVKCALQAQDLSSASLCESSP